MLREGWNFQGDIAVPLEHVALGHYGNSSRHIYNADLIAGGDFVKVMLKLLRSSRKKNDRIYEIEKFAKDCEPYSGVGGSSIPKEKAQELFDRFCELYDPRS